MSETKVNAKTSTTRGISRHVLRTKVLLLIALVIVVGGMLLRSYLRGKQHARCVIDAEIAVAKYLSQHPNEDSGKFRRLVGQGYEYPVGFSPAGFYLSAYRTAIFSKTASEVRILVHPMHKKSRGVVIGKLRVEDLGGPNHWFNVEHPDLKP